MLKRLMPVAVVLFMAVPALAADKVDAKKLKGTWQRELDNNKISFEFKDEKTFRCVVKPNGADDGPTVDCEYTIEKDGTINFTITEIDKKGAENFPNKGDKFSFKIEAGKEKLTISEFKGTDDADAKKLVEGEYTKKK